MSRPIGELANHEQSPVLSSGGGGNRKQRVSRRSRQLQVITGNPIPSYRNQNTRKSTFGKTLCQLAKSNARRRGEGRTWESCPPPRPWARSRARSCRAPGMRSRESWRAPCYGYLHLQNRNRDRRPRSTRRSPRPGLDSQTWEPGPTFMR